MVNVHTRRNSHWKYDTSSSTGASAGIVATEFGKLFLKSPGGQPVTIAYSAVGAGASVGFKLPGVGKLEVGGKGVSVNAGLKDNTSGGAVFILESFKGRELASSDITGFCLLLELGVAVGQGLTGSAIICNLSLHDLHKGLLEEFVIDSSVSPIVADALNKAGLTDKLGIRDATAVILMYGYNQGIQAFAGGTAYLGYLSLHGPPEKDPIVILDVPIKDTPIEVVHTLREGELIQLPEHVLFPFGEYRLTSKAHSVLAEVAIILRSHPVTKIIVNGYTDSIGPADFNMTLSRYRAKTVAEWLGRHMGPTSAQIHWEGFGAANPVAPNRRPDGSDNPLGRRRNRRIKIQFFKE